MTWGFSDILKGVGILSDLTGGGKKENGGAGSQSETRDPWGPSQPYILRGLRDTSTLNDYYKQNPFSDLQKKYYGQQFSDIDNFRNTVAPGLMAFANSGMTGGYQRGASTIPQRGAFSLGPSYSGNTGNTGNTGGGTDPFASVFKPTAPTVPTVPTVGGSNYFGGGAIHGGGGSSLDRSSGKAGNGTNFTDAQWKTIKAMNDESGFFGNPVNQIGLGAMASFLSPSIAGLLGFPGGDPMTAQQRSEQAIAARDATNNPMSYDNPEAQAMANAYREYASSRTGYGGRSDFGYGGDYNGGATQDGVGVGSSENSRSSRDAAASRGTDTGGGDTGGAATGGRDTGGGGSDASGGGDTGTRGGFAKGGYVTKGLLSGPDPKGPDDGAANLDAGEYVIKKSAVKKIGKKKLDKLNKG